MNPRTEQFYLFVSAMTSRVINFIKPAVKYKEILVIKWDEIGDMVYALHVFDHLREQYPNAAVTLLCKPFVTPLVTFHPAIHRIISDIPHDEKFDMIVELRGNWETLKYALRKIPNRRLERGEIRIKNKFYGGQKHEAETNFEIIEPLLKEGAKPFVPKIYIDIDSETAVAEFITKSRLSNFAVLHCGARRILRQWPAKNFALLVKLLRNKYGLQVVFAGTKEDEAVIEEIKLRSGEDTIDFTDNYSLLHLAALVKKAALFIGNESGPLHIAAVMQTPLVGIYGPGVKDVFYPIGETSKVVHHVLECNPCDQIHCVRPDNPCINLVTVEEVEEKIQKLLEQD